jgi:hypothetical protein
MQYCVSRVRLGPGGNVAEVEWGPLDGHPLVLVREPTVTEPDALVNLIRRGRLVWASFPTPFGLVVGGLLRIGRDNDGLQTLELASGPKQRSLRDMAQL